MADHDPSDPHAHHSEVIASMRQATDPVATEWTTDLIHAHMEHLDGRSDPLTAATLDAMGWLLERVEALSDRGLADYENFVRADTELTEARSTIERLEAIIGPEAHCKSCGSVVAMQGERAGECDCTENDMDERQRLGPYDGDAIAEIARLRTVQSPGNSEDVNWYSTMRRRVEAAHAAAKEAAR